MSDPHAQRDMMRRLEQTQVKEVPGGISGFTSFYASGVWAPTLVGAGTAGTFTYDATNTGGAWTRIGNRVLLNGRMRITTITVAPTGNMTINGLPITSAVSAFGVAGGAAFAFWRGITLPAGYTELQGNINSAVATIEIYRGGSNVANAQVQGAEVALVGGVITFAFFGEYQV